MRNLKILLAITSCFWGALQLQAETAVTYQDIQPILNRHCVGCHSGSMDLRAFPFESSYPTQDALVEEMIRRFKLTTWQRMPPPRVQESPLPQDTIVLFERWLADGLLSGI